MAIFPFLGVFFSHTLQRVYRPYLGLSNSQVSTCSSICARVRERALPERGVGCCQLCG